MADVRAAGGADGYVVLGDLAAGGYDPVVAVERLRALPDARFVRGNTEATLAGDPADMAPMFAWARERLAGAGLLKWLQRLPLEVRLTLPDGTRLLGSHAAPGSDGTDGRALLPVQTEEEVRALLAGCSADLVCAGHSHWPMDRTVADVRILNVGSVSNSLAPDLRACWTLLDADAHGYRAEQRRIAYDLAAALDAVYRSGHPTPEFMAAHLRGERTPAWLRA